MYWPKHCGMLLPVVKVHGVDGAKRLIDRAFQSRDPLLVRSHCALEAIIQRVNVLIGEEATASNGTASTAPWTAGNTRAIAEAKQRLEALDGGRP